MSRRHVLLALLVMVIWGANFVVISRGLAGVPPLVFVALRFLLIWPLVALVPRPEVPWRHVALVGLFLSVGQFGFLYSAIAAGMPPGLASLVLQLQAALTVVLAAALLGERPVVAQVVGVAVGVLGLVLVAVGRGGHVPLAAFVLCVLGAASWAMGNVVVRRLRIRGGLSLTVWSALVVPVPMLALSLVLDGPAVVGHALTHLSLVNWLSTAYTAVLASLVGYSIWNSLLAHYPASTVAPFTLLVPVVGMSLAYLADGEVPTPLALVGAVVLIAGVGLTILGRRVFGSRRPVAAARSEVPAPGTAAGAPTQL